METPAAEPINIIVSTLTKANMHLTFAADANILDIKTKVADLEHITIKKYRVYLIKTKFKIFQTKSKPIEDIQKLKDIIAYHKTNKFLVCEPLRKKQELLALNSLDD
jgi:transcription initiation factor IIE alpha subunit